MPLPWWYFQCRQPWPYQRWNDNLLADRSRVLWLWHSHFQRWWSLPSLPRLLDVGRQGVSQLRSHRVATLQPAQSAQVAVPIPKSMHAWFWPAHTGHSSYWWYWYRKSPYRRSFQWWYPCPQSIWPRYWRLWVSVHCAGWRGFLPKSLPQARVMPHFLHQRWPLPL